MTQLPGPLQPWSAALQLFPDELAVGLGAWLPRLAMAIGPLRARADEGRDEPDGFDGLSRRGPYERLLSAEWALADVFPEEFTRRAASGEHAFFRLAFRAPAGERRCIALLDSGPSQLGTPRLAHLAALVVLERRAREAKAEFLWGVLQQPPGRCLTRVDASAVDHWMRARCATEPRPDDLTGWREFFGPTGLGDELWLLGSHRVQRLAGTSALVVHEGTERLLGVDVRLKGALARTVTLPLPSDEICTRLIRDPLRREAPVTKGRAPASNLCFIGGGTRLAYLAENGDLIVQLIPGAPGEATSAQVVKQRDGDELLAVGWDRGLVTVTQQGTAVRWTWYSKRAGLRGQGAWHLHATVGNPVMGRPRTLGVALSSGWFVSGRHELVCTELNRTYRVVPTRAHAALTARQQLAVVKVAQGEARFDWFPPAPGDPADDSALSARSPELSPEAPVVFGFDQLSRLGVMAGVGLSDGRWQVMRLSGGLKSFARTVPDGARVVGALMGPGDRYEPGLLAIERDGRTLSAVYSGAMRRVLRMDANIERCATSPFNSHVAIHSADHQLVVYSLRRQQVVLRLQCEVPP